MESHTPHSFLSDPMRSLCALALLCAVHICAFDLSENDLATTRSVVNHIFKNQYDSAFRTLDSRNDADAEPLLALLKLTALSMRDVDYERCIDSALFLTTYDKTLRLTDSMERIGGSTSYTKMVAGICRATHSAYYIRQKKYMSGLQNGLDAVKLLQEAQALDSTNYETDLMLGLYEYGRAELRSRFWWVLFWYGGDKKSGIERIERCAAKAVMTKDAARISLCDVYLQEKRFDDARRLINIMKQEYAESRFVLWAEVKYFESCGNYRSAAQLYGRLSHSYEREELGEYNMIFTRYRQAWSLNKAGDQQGAASICVGLLSDARINTHKDLKKETKKLLESCNASKHR